MDQPNSLTKKRSLGLAALTTEQRSTKAKKAASTSWAKESAEQRSANAQKGWTGLTVDERSRRSKKMASARWSDKPSGQRSAAAKNVWKKLTPEQWKERVEKAARARVEKSTPAQRSRRAKKAWAKRSPEARTQIAKKVLAKSTHEQRSARSKKIWENRPAGARLKLAEKVTQKILENSTPAQRSRRAKKAAKKRFDNMTPADRSAIGTRMREYNAELKAKAALWEAIQNAGAVTKTVPTGVPLKPGPERDLESAKRVAKIVAEVWNGEGRSWRGDLYDICEVLDSAIPPLPCPDIWVTRHGISTWCRAAVKLPHVAIKAIEARLRNAQK
jgi:hypothetical protein